MHYRHYYHKSLKEPVVVVVAAAVVAAVAAVAAAVVVAVAWVRCYNIQNDQHTTNYDCDYLMVVQEDHSWN